MSNSDLNIERINELAKKKKSRINSRRSKGANSLKKAYLESFRKGFKQQIENTKVIDPEGNDVTPEKIKEIQQKEIIKIKTQICKIF